MIQETAARDLAVESFDTFQRMTVIQRVCRHLSTRDCGTAVDIGGYPGLLASHLSPLFQQVHVVDLPRCEWPSCVQGSVLELPIRSQAVDVAVSADVLEHVVESERAIREILRVARRAVVISAPWKSDATDQVEERLVEWHRLLTGEEHPWLSEHRECGLPDREAALDIFRDSHWTTLELACGNLTEWTLLQFAGLMREIMPEGEANQAAIHEALNRAWPDGLSTSIPTAPYRTVIVAVSEPDLIDGMAEDIPQDSTPPAILAALPLMESHLKSLLALAAASGAEARSFDETYCERLEALTRQQAAEIESMRRQITERGSGVMDQILRKMRSLFSGK